MTSLLAVVACKPQTRPYVDALLPRDQIFDQEEEEMEQPAARRPPRREESSSQSTSTADTAIRDKSTSPPSSPPPSSPPLHKPSTELPTQARINSDTFSDENVIDNPYLRPVKIPRKSKGK